MYPNRSNRLLKAAALRSDHTVMRGGLSNRDRSQTGLWSCGSARISVRQGLSSEKVAESGESA